MIGPAAWSREADSLRLVCGSIEARVSASNPAGGLENLKRGGVSLAGLLLADPAVEHAAAETYVRGLDFVGTYPPSADFPFRSQRYWSARALTGDAVALTLTLSLQTDLLDSAPRVELVSRVLGAEAELDAEGRGVLRVPDGGMIVVAPHPTDAPECVVDTLGEAVLLRVAPPFLEKGVIRRVRIAAIMFPPGGGEPDAVGDAVGDWADDPLPLTA